MIYGCSIKHLAGMSCSEAYLVTASPVCHGGYLCGNREQGAIMTQQRHPEEPELWKKMSHCDIVKTGEHICSI